MKIGILALQGDFHEHQTCFNKLEVETQLVKSIEELNNCDSLVIPGGESTTISKLLSSTKMDKVIIKKALEGFPIWGTCAGLILISNKIIENAPEPLKLINITTSRNFYGRQIDSFEETLEIEDYSNFRGVFIRAPAITDIGKTKAIAYCRNKVVGCVEGQNMALTFHPELTNDSYFHKMWIERLN